MKPESLSEKDLFEPVKSYLESLGYKVNAEVQECDIVARKHDDPEDEIIIIELKKTFNLKLVYQIISRQEICDSVYAAIPVSDNTPPAQFKKIKKLLKRLGAGLIFIKFFKTKTRAEIMFHPDEYSARKRHKKRKAIIRETIHRVADKNIGGSTTSQKRVTLYRQNAIQIAVYLSLLGEASPKELVNLGTGKKTRSILSDNHYGWFERVKRGVYRIHKDASYNTDIYTSFVDYYKALFQEESSHKSK